LGTHTTNPAVEEVGLVHQFKNPGTLKAKEVFLHILPGKG